MKVGRTLNRLIAEINYSNFDKCHKEGMKKKLSNVTNIFVILWVLITFWNTNGVCLGILGWL